jgi:hypothetical protein
MCGAESFRTLLAQLEPHHSPDPQPVELRRSCGKPGLLADQWAVAVSYRAEPID